MTRLDRNTSLAWIGGRETVPAAVASYRVHNVSKSPERSTDNPNPSYVGAYQPGPARAGGRYFDISFSTEFRGSDSADVPPPDGALLRACTFAETVNGTTPNIGYKYAVGDPHLNTGNPAGETDIVALNLYQDGLYRQINNCVGDVTVSFIAGQVPTFDYSFRGTVTDAVNGWITGTATAFSTMAYPRPVEEAGLTATITRSGTVTGTVTGTSSTTVCIDSTATYLSDGLYAGDAVALDIGGETATIVSVDSETQFTSTALSGAGTYDSAEAYTITRATSYATASTELVIPSIVYSVGNIIDDRRDANGEQGYSPPIITGRKPTITMVVEVPQLYDMNFEYEFINNSTLDITWVHEAGYGDRHEATMKFSGVINSMPVVSEQNGKLIYTLTMDQGITTGDDPFSISWQGT